MHIGLQAADNIKSISESISGNDCRKSQNGPVRMPSDRIIGYNVVLEYLDFRPGDKEVRVSHFSRLLTLQWRQNERYGVSNQRHVDCFFNRLLRHSWNNTSKLCLTGLCDGNRRVTGGFPPQRTSNAENVCFWLRHHGMNSMRQGLNFSEIFLASFHSLKKITIRRTLIA